MIKNAFNNKFTHTHTASYVYEIYFPIRGNSQNHWIFSGFENSKIAGIFGLAAVYIGILGAKISERKELQKVTPENLKLLFHFVFIAPTVGTPENICWD